MGAESSADAFLADECLDVPSDLPLEADRVINLEAPLYLAGAASLQIERTFLITPTGPRALVAQESRQPFRPAGGQVFYN